MTIFNVTNYFISLYVSGKSEKGNKETFKVSEDKDEQKLRNIRSTEVEKKQNKPKATKENERTKNIRKNKKGKMSHKTKGIKINLSASVF